MTLPMKPDDATKARSGRNLALGLGLVAFVILIFVVTIVRLGGSIVDRPL